MSTGGRFDVVEWGVGGGEAGKKNGQDEQVLQDGQDGDGSLGLRREGFPTRYQVFLGHVTKNRWSVPGFP